MSSTPRLAPQSARSWDSRSSEPGFDIACGRFFSCTSFDERTASAVSCFDPPAADSVDMPHKRLARLAPYLSVLCLFASPAASARAAERDAQPSSSSAPAVKVTIYPILIQAPIFGATVELPALPSGPGGGGGEGGPFSGSTEAGLNSAYGGGLSVEGRRWFVEANGTWAGLGAERDLPRLTVDSDVFFLDGRAGVRLFDGVSATAGFRRVSVDLQASMTLPAIDR